MRCARLNGPPDLTGTNRERPGLHQAPAACRAGDRLVVTTFDRLARLLPDVRTITGELTQREFKLDADGSVHDPIDPAGPAAVRRPRHGRRVESDLVNMRTKEGMKVARKPELPLDLTIVDFK